MRADGIERHRFTGLDVDRMVEAGILEAQGRWELIDGEIVPMASMHTPHGRTVMRLTRIIDRAIDQSSFELFAGVTVELSPMTRVDPDLYVARAGVTAKIVPASEVLWAIAVADATRRKDLKVKAPLYGAAGVPELWVVDLEDRVTHIHRGPAPDGWSEPVRVVAFSEAAAPAMFPQCLMSISDLG